MPPFPMIVTPSPVYPITPANGGTGVASPTAHGVAIGEGSSNFVFIVSTASYPLVGANAADPAFVNLVDNLQLTNPLALASGGIGISAVSAHSILVGTGGGSLRVAAVSAASYPLRSLGSAFDPDYRILGADGGGTGHTVLPAGAVILGNSTGLQLQYATPKQSGFVLTDNGPGSLPSFQAAATSSSSSSGSGVTTLASAATLNLHTPTNSPITILVTGTVTSTNISNPPAAGTEVTLVAQSASWNITNGNHWNLLTNFTSVANGILRGVFDASGNFVESSRSPGQGVKQCVWRQSAATNTVQNSAAPVTYTDMVASGITTPTILASDLIRLGFSGGYVQLSASPTTGSEINLTFDRGGTKIGNSLMIFLTGSTLPSALAVAGNLLIEDSPAAGSTYTYKPQMVNSAGTAQFTIAAGTWWIELWR